MGFGGIEIFAEVTDAGVVGVLNPIMRTAIPGEDHLSHRHTCEFLAVIGPDQAQT